MFSHKTLNLGLLQLFIFLSDPLLGQKTLEGAWRLTSNKNDTMVHALEVPGKSLLAFRGQKIFNVKPLELLWFIRNDKEWPKWIELYDGGAITQQKMDKVTYFQVFKAPSVIMSKRYLNCESQAFRLKGSEDIIIEAKSISTERPQSVEESSVLMTLLYSQWILKPIDNGSKTSVQLTIMTDPGGWLPHFIVNFVQKDYAVNLFAKMEDHMSKITLDKAPIPPEQAKDYCFVCPEKL